MTITDPALFEYAALLQENGFTVYDRPGPRTHFVYSRIVDGRELFGIVQQCTLKLEGYSHCMPIKPSRENGSSMFLDDVPDGFGNLTVENAEKVASPTNSNSVIGGPHQNYYSVGVRTSSSS